MFLRRTERKKNGKAHSYWNVVENKRLDDGRVVQRHVLYLGEINSSQAAAWRKAIEVFDEDAGRSRTLALFPEDRCDAIASDTSVDDLIAGILNRNGLVTGHGNRWTRERVTALRSHHKIPVFRPVPDGNEPWLNLNKAASLLGIAPKTLRLAAEAGEIEAGHPLPDGPWIFSRSTLGEPAAQRIVHRARQNPNHPTGSHPDQQNLFSSIA
ncbi:hypothetical protein SAMN05443247_11884 [Bradyrhizobium erythrophlei]|nr:hypothetical protein SAMN05443247_11884 [Bradyrhizobium erythrophlei]